MSSLIDCTRTDFQLGYTYILSRWFTIKYSGILVTIYYNNVSKLLKLSSELAALPSYFYSPILLFSLCTTKRK